MNYRKVAVDFQSFDLRLATILADPEDFIDRTSSITRLSRLVGCGSCFVASLALAAGGCQGQGQEEMQQEQVSLPDRHGDSTAGVAIVRKPSSLPAANYASDDQEHQKTIIPFLNRHCVRCHGPEVQEASFRVDQVANDFLTRSVAERWSEIFDRLHLGDMPPRDEPQPLADGIARVTDWISRERLRGEQARRGTGIVIRRLNRVEYQNTIRDLIGVDLLSTEEFPADPPAGGFDNNGAVLTISPLHLELYLKTAQAVVDRAIVTGQDRPPVIKWRVELEAGETAIAEQFHKQIRGQFIYGSGGNSLKRRLGHTDQQKLEEYLSSVRQTEQRVQRLQSWVDIPKADVESSGLRLNAQPNRQDVPLWLDVMLELCFLALKTDTTRVITFQWSREAGGFGGGGEDHHELSHHGGDAGMLTKLAAIDRFHVGNLARFLGLLGSGGEAGGNLLDNTLVLYGSGMNSGQGGGHSPKNVPLLLAGGRKLGLKHGSHLKIAIDSAPLSNLLLTMLNAIGVKRETFMDSTGTLTGLV